METSLGYIILMVGFAIGSFFNLSKRRQCDYSVVLTLSRMITILLTGIVFFVVAYIGGGSLNNYLVVMMGWLYIFSGIISEGVSVKGIHYFNGMTMLISTDKWENIKKITLNKTRYTVFNFSSSRSDKILYYALSDFNGIKAYITKHIEKHTDKDKKRIIDSKS